MSWPQSAAPDLYLERARDRVGHSRTYKSPKTPFFAQKYLTRYTQETFFEEYTNLQAHYLSHCRDIPLQSFESHIRPQPHGLGLRTRLTNAPKQSCKVGDS